MNDVEFENDWDVPCNETSDAAQLCRNPLVSVIMYAFNHEKFIAEAIEGVVMQEADFEYELIIGEDCSQDRTREICFEYQRRYPDRIRVLWSATNLHHIKGNSRRCRARARGKYIAYHDGDDYWTDPKKLQKQVEYMEGHPGGAGCFHERVKCDEEGRIMEGSELPEEIRCMQTWQSLMDVHRRTYTPPTCTAMWRKEVLVDRPEWMNKVKSGGDFMTAFWAAYAHGTVDWVEGVKPSVYRIHAGGVFRGLTKPRQIMLEHMDHQVILQHFPIPKAIRRDNHLLWEKETYRAWRLWHDNESKEVRGDLRKLISNDVIAWPALRWRLWARQAGYFLKQGCWRAWHGVVMGGKRVLPGRLYGWLREGWRQRNAGGRA